MRTAALVALAAALGACVPYPNAPDDDSSSLVGRAAASAYTGLGEGANVIKSQHFKLAAYGDDAQKDSDVAESDFTQLVQDIGLVTFLPMAPYKVVVYGSQDEYRKKTGQPDWSIGVVANDGSGSIYTYASDRLPGVLSHLITNAVVMEYLNQQLVDQERWMLDGLETYEEFKTENRRGIYDSFTAMLTAQPIPLDQLENMYPPDERGYDVTLWYAEAYGIIRWFIESGGKINFATFLGAIHDGKNFDQAVQAAYAGRWNTLADVFADWQRSLQ